MVHLVIQVKKDWKLTRALPHLARVVYQGLDFPSCLNPVKLKKKNSQYLWKNKRALKALDIMLCWDMIPERREINNRVSTISPDLLSGESCRPKARGRGPRLGQQSPWMRTEVGEGEPRKLKVTAQREDPTDPQRALLRPSEVSTDLLMSGTLPKASESITEKS